MHLREDTTPTAANEWGEDQQYDDRPYGEARTSGGARASASTGASTRGWLAFWYAVTAPAEPSANAAFRIRESARRGRLLSVILLGLAVILAGAFYQYLVVDDDHPLMVAVLCMALGLAVIAAVLNRLGQVTPAGILMVVVAEVPLAGPLAATKGGELDILHIGAFYLSVGSLLVAASVLAPWSVAPVALFNCVASLVILNTRPQTPALAALLASNDGQQAFLGPIVMQVIVAIIAYLWAQNTLTALRRADRAEEIAALERREVERQRELEEGVRELLTVHVAVANGDFTARVPQVRNPLMWQVGRSLNTLIGRLVRYAQAEFLLQREQEEAQRLAQAIAIAQVGRPVAWPVPSGLPLDPVTDALRAGQGRSAGGASGAFGSGPSSPADGERNDPRNGPRNGPRDALPDWLRH